MYTKQRFSFNCFLTDDDTRSFCGQCRSKSDWTERGVISDLHFLDFNKLP